MCVSNWARVLAFVGNARPAIVARAVLEALPFCLVELAALSGVAAFLSTARPPPSLAAETFAAALLFAHDEVLGRVDGALIAVAKHLAPPLVHHAVGRERVPDDHPIVSRGCEAPVG